MKKVLLGVFALLFSASLAGAQTLDPIEPIGSVKDQTITVYQPLTDVDKMIAGGASINSTATNNTLNVNANVSDSNTDTPDGAYNHYIAGGAVYGNTAANNTVNVSSGVTVTGKAVVGGLARNRYGDADKWGTGNALNNVVNIKGTTITVAPQTPDSVFYVPDASGNNTAVAVAGGASQFFNGNASGNSVNITGNATINGAVVGGLSYVETTQQEVDDHGALPERRNDNNSIYIKDSTVNGMVYGSYGGVYGNGNSVTLDNAIINGDAYAAQSGFTSFTGTEAKGTFDYNSLRLLNGTTVNSAAAVSANNNNANNNLMYIDGSTVNNGTLYAVKMIHFLEDNSSKLTGTTNYNNLYLVNTPTTAFEIGGAINFVGSPSNNSVNIKNSDVTLTFDATKTLGGEMDITTLTNSKLLGTQSLTNRPITPALNTTNGYIFGGATADYTQKTAVAGEIKETIKGFGTAADHNVVNIEGGTVNANVVGGFAAYVRQEDHTTREDGENGSYTITEVHKVGLTTTTTITGQTCAAPEGGNPPVCTALDTDIKTDTAIKIDEVFSASNNTVMLKNVQLTGDVYGGYVDGAELKQENMKTENNTVIIAGNTAISGTVYGGSNAFFSDTNSLVFQNVANGNNFVTYRTSQFKNFNGLWNIQGNFDTRLEFDKGDVHALFGLDASAMRENAAQVVLRTGLDLDSFGPVNCNGSLNCTKYNSDIALSQNRMGIYTFYLNPVINGTMVDWVLSNVKDTANVDAYGQLPLIGLAIATAGTDMISSTIENALADDNDSSSFIDAAYNQLRYKTGSGFDLDSTVVHAGGWKKFTDTFLLGIFGEYANGSYDTFPIKVSGDASSYAGGLMTAWKYSETGRLEANVRLGSLSVDFNSTELVSSFKSSAMYYGAGAGFVEQVSDFSLYGGINWLRTAEQEETDNLGQKIKFDALQSTSLKFGGRYTLSSLTFGSGFVPTIGIGGSYEMDGDSSVMVEDLHSDKPSLSGLSGRADLGLFYNNNDQFLPLKTSLNFFGVTGQQQGFGGEIKVAFKF